MSDTPLATLIEPARLEDAPAIADIEVSAWREAYAGIVPGDVIENQASSDRLAMWREVIDTAMVDVLCARRAGVLIGFVAFGPVRETGEYAERGEIFAFYVRPAMWSHGVGRSLWQAAQGHLRLLGIQTTELWVLSANERARRFYAAAGFVPQWNSERSVFLDNPAIREVRLVLHEPD